MRVAVTCLVTSCVLQH